MAKICKKLSAPSKHIKEVISAPISTEHEHLVFSFKYLQDSHCISKCTKDDKAQFTETLRILGRLTWAQVNKSGRHQNGCEIIKLSSIKASKPLFLEEKGINLLAFRFSGMKPMVGFRDNQIFHVMWFDRDYKFYSHG